LFSPKGALWHAVFLALVAITRFAGFANHSLVSPLAVLHEPLFLFDNDCPFSAPTWAQFHGDVSNGIHIPFVVKEPPLR
jgi:hypothetical protein